MTECNECQWHVIFKGAAMNREPTDLEVVGMALIAAPALYVLLWLAMAIF